jgi:hypothetical protein
VLGDGEYVYLIASIHENPRVTQKGTWEEESDGRDVVCKRDEL